MNKKIIILGILASLLMVLTSGSVFGEITGCDVAANDCSSACDELFSASSSGWTYSSFGSGVCKDVTGAYETFPDATCDALLSPASGGDCAASNMDGTYCPGYNRNGGQF